MATQFLCTLLLAWAVCHLTLGVEYNYDTSDTTYGPNGWASTYPGCSGSSQSPIDIQTANTMYDSSLGDLTLNGFDSVPSGAKFTAQNNGHSFVVLFTPNMFEVSGGGLPGTFYTLQFHLHWGRDTSKGSEHTINSMRYPAELHIVNVNKKYANVSEALKNSDGIAVLGVLLKVGDENTALTSFLKYAANVTIPSSAGIENIAMSANLGSLLPTNHNEFYRYNGSLTTPTCAEAVKWTVFKNIGHITTAQLDMLKSLKASDNTTNLVDTFRPVQQINSRTVKRSFSTLPTISTTASTTMKPTDDAASHVANTMAILLSVVVATVMILFGTF